MKKVLILASVASMIDQFNMRNIAVLKKLGYEVHVAANFENGSTSSNERISKFKKELSNLNIPYYHIDFSRKIINIAKNIKAYKQIKKIMIENKYEFVHCHSPIGGVCGRIAAKKTNTKVIYTAHGFHFFKGAPLLNWIIYYPIEKILSYITDILITINKEDYELAIKKMKAQRIYYLPGIGVDIMKFQNTSVNTNEKRLEINIPIDSVMLLSVGELNKNKNHEVIIKAISELNNPNIHYCIAGRGKLSEYIKKLCYSLNVSKQVHLLGFREDIAEIYKIADIFCFPSYREGLSVALMEVMSVGLPIVCSNIRGNVDLIKDEKGGYLFTPNCIDELKIKISQLVDDSRMRENMKKYNQTFIKNFDYIVVEKKMLEIYGEILNEKKLN